MPRPKRDQAKILDEASTPPPTLSATQRIARVKQAAGNNLYHLELPSGEAMLAELHPDYRSTIWMRWGSYVVVDTAALADRGNKIGGEIQTVIREEKAWRKMSYWPTEFGAKKVAYGEDSDDDRGPQMPPSDSEDEQ